MVLVTPDNEPFVDLVQVRAEGEFGTGLLVGRGLVLTALHCVCDPKRQWRVRDRLGVYLLRDLQQGHERHLDAQVLWPRIEALRERPPDIAVLQIKGAAPPAPLVEHKFGELPRTPTTGSARGFPASAKGPLLPGGRIEHDQPGRVTYTSATRRALTIDATGPHDLKDLERWAGLSGGPLLANGLIVGVMREVPEGWRGEAVEAEPLPPFLRDEADESLRRFLAVKLPLAESSDPVHAALAKAYSVIGTEVFAASSRTLEAAAAKPFYGRSEDLAALDGALAAQDRGVLLLRGEAGLGKSRLAVRWAEHCAAAPRTTTLRHAFSVREPATGTRSAMVANLVRQAADSLGPATLGGGEPGDSTRLADRLASLLATDRPPGARLVVVLDALDEAAEPIEPWPTGLGRGVFILVTCRAEAEEEPRILRLWRERTTESGTLALYRTSPPLDAEAIAEWLTAATGQQIDGSNPLVARAMRASEGVPLFVSYLIPDAIAALQSGAKDPFPASFGDYARQRLTELRDRLVASHDQRWSWGKVLDLFAVLSVAKAPLPTARVPGPDRPAADWLRELVSPQRLDELDQRAERWLWRRGEHGDAVSFAHPRLATVFGSALPHFEPDIVVMAEERLVEACGRAWNGARRDPLRAYALTWLPAHLIELDRQQDAAALLGDGAFLLVRLAANPTPATVRATAWETIQLGPHLADTHPAFDWYRFWAETESQVVFAVERADSLSTTAVDVLVQLAHDRFGAEAHAFRSLAAALKHSPSGRLVRACGFRHPTLRRSLDHAHRGLVSGVLALADGLVSWGGDGAIRFWTFAGEPRPGGDVQAHQGGVGGVLALADGLVSWGGDGAIRFWTLAGESRSDGDLQAHRGRVVGVLALAGGLVSWGWDGAIRFWSLAGEPRPGGDPQAHQAGLGGVGGVLALVDGLVSWGEDGAIRFWTLAGEPRSGGDPQAHRGGVAVGGAGVLLLADGLVSWGWDGAIRFWSLAGEPRPGGDPQAHQAGVGGGVVSVLVLADGLVSWGQDGAIRFWTLVGEPRLGGAPHAHWSRVVGVLALADGLVSWGWDGAIRFWTLAGKPRPGGDPQAHQGGVGGVLALADRLVSWDGYGAIRFWTLAGKPRPGGDPQAHQGGVGGVLALADGLVSWGGDGAIRFWTLAGEPRSDGDLQAHRGRVVGVLAQGRARRWPRRARTADGLVSWGGGVLALADGLVSWGEDGAIRFWSLAGEPRPGGDPQAHRWGGVGGVLALADGLVSWGEDGAIRFWTLAGKPRPGGKLRRARCRGVLALADRLVSWDEYGAIRFWTLAGKPRPGGDPQAHQGGVGGVLALADRLVSWDGYGAIRFWTLAGKPRPGGDPQAHQGGVGGVLALADGLVSWGGDGAIRFWTSAGEPRPGGDVQAQRGLVSGVLALADGLVSWDRAGAIRFWTSAGEPRPGGDPQAHQGEVGGVLALADRLVSWGEDNIIRRWSLDGSPHGPAWIAPAPLDIVTKVADDLWVCLLGHPHRLLLS